MGIGGLDKVLTNQKTLLDTCSHAVMLSRGHTAILLYCFSLYQEFSDIFRRAFASRVFPPDVVEQLGQFPYCHSASLPSYPVLFLHRNEARQRNTPVRTPRYIVYMLNTHAHVHEQSSA